MHDEIELVQTEDGLAVLGNTDLVASFLTAYGLEGVPGTDLDLPKLSTTLNTSAGVLAQGSELAANSGRWMKLTVESAEAAKTLPMVMNSTSGASHAILRAADGKFAKNLQFVPTAAVELANPAMLAGMSGMMFQLALEQSLKEIADYLAAIDEKVEDVLRAQKDSALAEMIGVALVLDEAMTIRSHTGNVSEVSWSKIQNAGLPIATTQAYALRQLDAISEKVTKKARLGDLAKNAPKIRTAIQEWLAVLAQCDQLQDAIGILELDRAMDASLEELEQHKTGLRAAREKRRALIMHTTTSLLTQIEATARKANTRVLLQPIQAKAVIVPANDSAEQIIDFQRLLGAELSREAIDAKRWLQAVAEAKDAVVDTTLDHAQTLKEFSEETQGKARVSRSAFLRKVSAKAAALAGPDEDEVGASDGPGPGEDADTSV